jgi:hypothetical protein
MRNTKHTNIQTIQKKYKRAPTHYFFHAPHITQRRNRKKLKALFSHSWTVPSFYSSFTMPFSCPTHRSTDEPVRPNRVVTHLATISDGESKIHVKVDSNYKIQDIPKDLVYGLRHQADIALKYHTARDRMRMKLEAKRTALK